ncbi:thermonuclease family protein [Altererythrobacter sp. TH136]|nr:thermonuclease family protein [Altererythrobacter sp. TH136]
MRARPRGSSNVRSLAFLLALAATTSAQAGTLSGQPQVIDGDTLEISGQRVRLFGIDAPELSQTCNRSGQAWECGKAAREHLAGMISTAQVTCSGAEKDTYGRLVAVCQVSGVDLNGGDGRGGLGYCVPPIQRPLPS